MSDDLRTSRGFGVTDPVPVSRLSGTTGEEKKFFSLPPLMERALFNPGRVVPCPAFSPGLRSVADCRLCKAFAGLGEVEIKGKAQPEQAYRVLCRYPRPRALVASNGIMEADYRGRLIYAIKSEADEPETRAREIEMFVERPHALNCPVARAKLGVWRVELPPCPLCEYYRGLVEIDGRLHVLCSHRFTLTIRQTALGSSIL